MCNSRLSVQRAQPAVAEGEEATGECNKRQRPRRHQQAHTPAWDLAREGPQSVTGPGPHPRRRIRSKCGAAPAWPCQMKLSEGDIQAPRANASLSNAGVIGQWTAASTARPGATAGCIPQVVACRRSAAVRLVSAWPEHGMLRQFRTSCTMTPRSAAARWRSMLRP